MKLMKIFAAAKYAKDIAALAKLTGYRFGTLFGIWMECLSDRDMGPVEKNWAYFRGVTMELDW